MQIHVPFDSGMLALDIDEKNFLGEISPRPVSPAAPPEALIRQALAAPLGSATLRDVCARTNPRSVAIVVTDVTRPAPDHLFLPPILEQLHQGGVGNGQIFIIVALGMHRPCTEQELRGKLGDAVYDAVEVFNSEPENPDTLACLGTTSFGCPMWVNRRVVEADLVISTGVIEPHLFAGYSGGRKSVAIGVAGEETIRFQHQPTVFDDPNTRIGGIQGNRFHENAMEIARAAGHDFIINAVFNAGGEIVNVVAGKPETALLEGIRYADSIYKIGIRKQADIVITGVTPPKHTNIYQATRGASYVAFSPYPSVRPGGLIIIPASTEEGAGKGTGEQRYHDITRNAASLDDILLDIRRNGVAAGGHRAYLMALTLKHAQVVIVGSRTPDVVRELYMTAMDTVEEAMEYGFRRFGRGACVYSIPHSLHVVTDKVS